jgi:hypothetical protein
MAVDLPRDEPGNGAWRYAEVVAQCLEGAEGEVLAVAHSASGLFLPLLADLRPLRRLVFLAAAIPKLGASFVDQVRAEADAMFDPEWIGQDPTTDEEAALRFLFHDCEPEVARWALKTRAAWYPESLYTEACPLASWPEVPSSYIVCADDRTLRPEWSRRAARALLGVEAIDLPGGHCPHVSRPGHLADVLSTLAPMG